MGIMVVILVALSATKILTDKRKEFFREAGSGYNVNAYFCAVNVVATLEHSVQIIICAAFDLWLRSSFAEWYSYIATFLLLGWIAVSWALLFPLLVRRDNMVLVTSFCMLLTSFLFSGASKYTTVLCMIACCLYMLPQSSYCLNMLPQSLHRHAFYRSTCQIRE
jgi:hypothetical protein